MLRLFVPLLLVLAVATLAGCAEGPSHFAAPDRRLSVAEVQLDPESARAAINDYRARKGLQPLTLNPRLTKAAKRHSADLARHDRISHKGSDGSNPWKRVNGAGYEPRLAAENVGAGQRSLGEVIQGWKDSPGHNRNLLLPDATQMGIALVKDPGTRYGTFWTLVLAKPL